MRRATMHTNPAPVGESSLSTRAMAVLEMIADGRTYEQILAAYPDLTYRDIFDAADEALGRTGRDSAMHRAKRLHPRAYEPWTPQEDAQLRGLVAIGRTSQEIAGTLQRQPGAIASRMERLGLSAAKENQPLTQPVRTGTSETP